MYYAIAYLTGIFLSLLIFPKIVYKNPDIILEREHLKDNSPRNRSRVACELATLVCLMWPVLIVYVKKPRIDIDVWIQNTLTFVAKIFVKEMRDD